MKPTSMAQGFSLRQNFSWTLVGNVFYSACQWGILIVLAKLGTPEMVGTFTFAFAVTAPLFMFFNLQLRVVQATDAQAQFTFNDYLGLRLASTLMALGSLALIAALLPYDRSTVVVVLIIGLAKAIESMSDVCYGYMQQQERMDFIAVSLVGRGTLSLLLLVVGIIASGTVVGGVIGLTVAWMVMLLGYDFPVMRRFAKTFADQGFQSLKPVWQWQTQRKLIALTLPLGFVMLLISLNTNIPRYFIEHFLSPRDLGIFAAIAYLMLVGSIIQGALAQAASPRLAKYYTDGRRRAFASLLFKLMGLGALLGAIGVGAAWLWGRELLTLLYKAEYAQYSDLLIWLMVAAALEYITSFLGTGITSARYFRVQVPLFATTAVIMAIACFLLIPNQGLSGISIAMIVTGILRVLLCFAILVHALRKPEAIEAHPQSLYDA